MRRFKGNHNNKKRGMYNTGVGGFQEDTLCQDIFAYPIFVKEWFRPQKYTDQGFSPLH